MVHGAEVGAPEVAEPGQAGEVPPHQVVLLLGKKSTKVEDMKGQTADGSQNGYRCCSGSGGDGSVSPASSPTPTYLTEESAAKAQCSASVTQL